jgi:hypothetical protein
VGNAIGGLEGVSDGTLVGVAEGDCNVVNDVEATTTDDFTVESATDTSPGKEVVTVVSTDVDNEQEQVVEELENVVVEQLLVSRASP